MRATAEALSRRKFRPVADPQDQDINPRINPEWTGEDTEALGKLMKDHPNFACLGAIGPDFFFFVPDFRDKFGVPLSSILVEISRFIQNLYDELDPYISKYEKYLGPISEDNAEEMSRLTGGLSESVDNIAGELKGILINALEGFAVQQVNIFEFFSLGLNRGYDEQGYLWSDMLHYRQTGQFGRALWERANQYPDPADRDKAKAYVLGYLTHMGTDVTGHPFVNSVAGGPYRLHWQRHHLAENHMDAFWYLKDILRPGSGNQYPQLTESALYYDIAFAGETNAPVNRPSYPTGGTLRDNWKRRRLLDLDSELASPIAELLYNAISDVFYKDDKHPKILRGDDGKPDAQLIGETYNLLFKFLKLTTVDGFGHERPEPPDVYPNLQFPTLSDPQESAPDNGGSGGDDSNWWDDVLDFILSVIKVLAYIAEVAAYLATLPWAILADTITYPLRLGLYYALELPLFHMFKHFRAVLVMSGYLMPMEDEIAIGLVHIGIPDALAFQSVLDDIGDIFPGFDQGEVETTPYPDNRYPHLTNEEREWKQPWKYPFDELPERCGTISSPYARFATPEVLFVPVPTDPTIRYVLETAPDPAAVSSIGSLLTPTRHLGDAVSFSSYLVWLHSRDNPQPHDDEEVRLVDWNLDSDRGYGHHCWDWNRKTEVSFLDQDGYSYGEPCTWPQQADPPADNRANPGIAQFNPTVPLKVHWTGPDPNQPGKSLPDPGCHIPDPVCNASDEHRPPGITNKPAAKSRKARGNRGIK